MDQALSGSFVGWLLARRILHTPTLARNTGDRGMLMEIPMRKQDELRAGVNEHWQRFSVAFEYPVYFT